MITKIRKQIYLEPEQDLRLKRMSAATGLSEAEIIRRALDARLNENTIRRPDLTAWIREREFIRQLIAAGPVAGGRTWKREDVYDRDVSH